MKAGGGKRNSTGTSLLENTLPPSLLISSNIRRYYRFAVKRQHFYQIN
jgi:hypothetical protein